MTVRAHDDTLSVRLGAETQRLSRGAERCFTLFDVLLLGDGTALSLPNFHLFVTPPPDDDLPAPDWALKRLFVSSPLSSVHW